LTISGVAAGHPKLAFAVTAGSAARPLKAVMVRLSSGLSFARSAGRVAVTSSDGRPVAFSSRVVSGRLQLFFSAPATSLRVSITPGAIIAARSLAIDVQRRRSPTVTVTVGTTDSSGLGFSARERVKPTG
jgi:hypothetical protein